MFSLKGKVAVVTGCDTGLGQGMALALAKAGASTIVGINIVEPIQTIKLVQEAGADFHNIICDLSKADKKQLIADIVNRLGTVDILVNNAGIIRREDSLNFSEKDWDDVIDLNQKSVFFLSQAFANHCVEAKHGGKIVNIAFMLSFQGG
ncbi:SDR family NAD(P)-dependent oxidoreductase, partial [Herbiconiux daphne]